MLVTRRFLLTCCPRPSGIRGRGPRALRTRPVPELDPLDPLGSPYFLPYPRSPLLTTGQKVLLISLPQSLHFVPDFSICSTRFWIFSYASEMIERKFKRSIIIRREYADEAPFCFVPVSRSLAENRTFKATR